MSGNSDKAAVWFSTDEKASIFYPFGVNGAAYLVPEKLAGRISRWTYWRAQLPLIIFTLGFVPLVDLWAPSLAASRRLEAPYFALALGLLAAIASAGACLGNRATYALLLKDCSVMHRSPSRAERKTCAKQFGSSRRNIIFLPLPVAFLGVAMCATTMFIGAVREDIPMWALGALISPLFWYAFVKDGVDQAIRWINARA
ncbi:MAG: hypothetical protein P4M13_04365 [Alphaproteobacteria bacterium]|nr:hypothetical protein [Alphaproteobacteria bacterium]